MNIDTVNRKLAESYHNILKASDIKKVYRKPEKLSGVFLPTVSEHYLNSCIKIMIVGKETRSWRNNTCTIKAGKLFSIDDIFSSMNSHEKLLMNTPKKSKFMQFYRQVSKAYLTIKTIYLPP